MGWYGLVHYSETPNQCQAQWHSPERLKLENQVQGQPELQTESLS